MNDNRQDARARLRDSVNTLAAQANLHAQMQKEPLKMLGGASAVGLVLGALVGSRVRRTRKVYVDAASNKREQKAFMKAQARVAKQQKGGGLGGMLMGLVVTTGVKLLQERVLAPKLEELTSKLADQQQARAGGQVDLHKGPVVRTAEADTRRM
ncbi:hypothetical protein [Deinococcus maricopensis]|uniref:Uncharacterized protein n=1 Tax=Deinococcus maricopensis (strain DSM 21211 / LMG 22137 / NRRL B-23946 / LB-34) TaxID=709986 RepID=E8UAN1_DEIML|nr:hypothetical protein [Deinococcus maricopensis]ADV68120.1 hypothetical protein Deima_2485 [Deinococcus maricopensis DSM 21211]